MMICSMSRKSAQGINDDVTYLSLIFSTVQKELFKLPPIDSFRGFPLFDKHSVNMKTLPLAIQSTLTLLCRETQVLCLFLRGDPAIYDGGYLGRHLVVPILHCLAYCALLSDFSSQLSFKFDNCRSLFDGFSF